MQNCKDQCSYDHQFCRFVDELAYKIDVNYESLPTISAQVQLSALLIEPLIIKSPTETPALKRITHLLFHSLQQSTDKYFTVSLNYVIQQSSMKKVTGGLV